MMSNQDSQLPISYRGFIRRTKDALIVVSKVHRGSLPRVKARPQERDRANIIKSGNIFVYTEAESQIRRWTDGITWSPSRIQGNFLIYRELNKAFPAGEKKRATKRKREHSSPDITGAQLFSHESAQLRDLSNEEARILIGSLTDSYDFKEAGLVKKTISVKLEGQDYHLVSYYNIMDVTQGRFPQPSAEFPESFIEPQLLACDSQSYRVQLDPHGNDMTNSGNSSPTRPVPPTVNLPQQLGYGQGWKNSQTYQQYAQTSPQSYASRGSIGSGYEAGGHQYYTGNFYYPGLGHSAQDAKPDGSHSISYSSGMGHGAQETKADGSSTHGITYPSVGQEQKQEEIPRTMPVPLRIAPLQAFDTFGLQQNAYQQDQRMDADLQSRQSRASWSAGGTYGAYDGQHPIPGPDQAYPAYSQSRGSYDQSASPATGDGQNYRTYGHSQLPIGQATSRSSLGNAMPTNTNVNNSYASSHQLPSLPPYSNPTTASQSRTSDDSSSVANGFGSAELSVLPDLRQGRVERRGSKQPPPPPRGM